MAQERSEKSPWKSRYGGGWVSDAQFLAESMVARKARHQKRGLPLGFWDLPKWKKEFLFQVAMAHRLLKTYSAAIIIKTLRRDEAKNIYSLGAKFLLPILEEEARRLPPEDPIPPSSVAEEAEPAPSLPSSQNTPTFVRKKSTLSKLRELDADPA